MFFDGGWINLLIWLLPITKTLRYWVLRCCCNFLFVWLLPNTLTKTMTKHNDKGNNLNPSLPCPNLCLCWQTKDKYKDKDKNNEKDKDKSTEKTQHVLYFWKENDSRISNMMMAGELVMMHQGYCTGDDATGVMHLGQCTRAEAPGVMHRGWCTGVDALGMMHQC